MFSKLALVSAALLASPSDAGSFRGNTLVKNALSDLDLSGLSSLVGQTPVTELNVTQYLGRWYQMYTDKVVMDTFEKDSTCDTADYHLLANGSIGLKNGDYNLTSGELNHIDGFATVPDSSQPGKLQVHFTDGTAPPFPAPYWVMSLGPLVENAGQQQYAYAIVADSLVPLGTLFVLARNVDEFNTKYDKEVNDELDKLGFRFVFNEPVKTVQGGNCSYYPVPSSTD